jgi:hypothetical protein
VIRLRVEADSSDAAALLVSEWARLVVLRADDALSVGGLNRTAVRNELERARQEFDAASQRYQSFLETTRLQEYQRDRDYLQALLTGTLYSSADEPSATLTAENAVPDPIRTRQTVQRTENAVPDPIRTRQTVQRTAMADIAGALERVEMARIDASALRVQVAQAGDGNTLPTLAALVRIQSRGLSGDLGGLTLQVPSGTERVTVAQIDALLAALATRRDLLLRRLNELETQGTAPDPTRMDLNQQFNRVNALLESERNTYRTLFQERELAWSMVDALSKKEQELNLARAGLDSPVRLFSGLPDQGLPVQRDPLSAGLVGAAVGLLAAMLLVLAIEARRRGMVARDIDDHASPITIQ